MCLTLLWLIFAVLHNINIGSSKHLLEIPFNLVLISSGYKELIPTSFENLSTPVSPVVRDFCVHIACTLPALPIDGDTNFDCCPLNNWVNQISPRTG